MVTVNKFNVMSVFLSVQSKECELILKKDGFDLVSGMTRDVRTRMHGHRLLIVSVSKKTLILQCVVLKHAFPQHFFQGEM